jgi:hypothetical protein
LDWSVVLLWCPNGVGIEDHLCDFLEGFAGVVIGFAYEDPPTALVDVES